MNFFEGCPRGSKHQLISSWDKTKQYWRRCSALTSHQRQYYVVLDMLLGCSHSFIEHVLEIYQTNQPNVRFLQYHTNRTQMWHHLAPHRRLFKVTLTLIFAAENMSGNNQVRPWWYRFTEVLSLFCYGPFCQGFIRGFSFVCFLLYILLSLPYFLSC